MRGSKVTFANDPWFWALEALVVYVGAIRPQIAVTGSAPYSAGSPQRRRPRSLEPGSVRMTIV
jgi:hypothetical protein